MKTDAIPTLSPAEIAAREAERALRLRAQLHATIRAHAKAWGLPRSEAILRAAIEPTETQAIVSVLRAWQASRRQVGVALVLSGPPGLGKSAALAHAVAHVETAEQRPALFTYAETICTTMKNGWSENAATWETWETISVLAIDELGLEDNPVALVRLLCKRFDRGLLSLLASNLSPREVAMRLADRRLASRTEGQPIPWIVQLQGEDMRTRGAR